MKLISWNINQQDEAWRRLLDLDADVALLQEATEPPSDVASKVKHDCEPWLTHGGKRRWRTAVVQLNNALAVNWLKPRAMNTPDQGDYAVSCRGTLSAAEIIGADGAFLTVLSMYGAWEESRPSPSKGWIFADASVHRIISDVAFFIGSQNRHRIVLAGDLNIYHGYGEPPRAYWHARYKTVFERMNAIGLEFIGPQFPNGRRAHPWPDYLPKDSKNVPTFYKRGKNPAAAKDQLDFVFASAALAKRVEVRARNEICDWGPSDHCQVHIEIR